MTVASPMRIDRVAGSARATRSADQLPAIRICGEGLGRQAFPRQAGLQGEQDADDGIASQWEDVRH